MSEKMMKRLQDACSQHVKRRVMEIIEEYPELTGKLEKCLKSGVRKIEVKYKHSISEPEIKQVNNRKAVIYLNN